MKKLLLIKLLFWITQAGISPQNIDKNRIEYLCERQYFLDNVYSMEFSVENLRRALAYSGIKSPQIAMRQAVLETANFTSELFIEGKNLFGMRPPKYRTTTCNGEFNYHATYPTWFHSVLDYKLWQDYYASLSYDLTCYYDFLITIQYATDILYTKKLQNLNII